MRLAAALALTLLSFAAAHAADAPLAMPQLQTTEGDYVAHNFHFRSGETMADLRLHYTTLGTPHRNAQAHVDNAVMVLHGTGGDGHQFLRPQFAGVLFVPGGLLDPAKYFIVLPDGIGHGKSSKPSDGMHAKFPHYDYDDMVAAQHALLVDGLHVDHARLIMGTSMGCMHSFIWGEMYPDYMDALMPLACQPVAIAGRNRMWRKMTIDAITNDPAWLGGEYTTEPAAALRTVADLLVIAGSAPIPLQVEHPTRDSADAALAEVFDRQFKNLDANDFLYQVSSSRNYDPSPKLESIRARVTWVNSADDFINPPELGIADALVKRMPHAKFVLIPASANTHGHGTHTWAAFWQEHLAALLRESERH